MSFGRGALTEEQLKRVEANRQRAMARVKRRDRTTEQAKSNGPSKRKEPTGVATTSMNQIRNGFEVPASHGYLNDPAAKRSRIELTPEQKKRLEDNRNKALEIRKRLALNNRDASKGTASSTLLVPDNVRIAQKSGANGSTVASKYEVPSIQRKDYIEYDFSTMKDSKGGFLDPETNGEGSNALVNDQTSLDEWKERQKQQLIVKDLAPPIDVENAPKCYECGTLELDPNLFTNFRQVRACRKCIKEKPDKYSMLTKTECKEDYLLTDPELKDVDLLPRIEKPNPHGYSRMQLFLRFQVEEYAWKKWGSSDKLDEEWERREATRIKRRDKKYNEQLLEMRKKTRAEEYTRKLRNGETLGDRHVHDWSAPLSIEGEENMVKKRCIDCGVETEEYVFDF